MTFTDSAIILSREPWREADKRASFFTLQHGKIDGIAVGAHKIKSKLSGHLEPLRAVDVMLAEGRQGYKIAQCVTRHNFVDAPIDVERVRCMGALVRLVSRATEAEHRDEVLHGLLFTGLAELQAASVDDLARVYGKNLNILAQHFGYAPVLDRCVVCGRAEDLKWFSPHLGGTLCKNERALEKMIAFTPGGDTLYVYVAALLKWRALI